MVVVVCALLALLSPCALSARQRRNRERITVSPTPTTKRPESTPSHG